MKFAASLEYLCTQLSGRCGRVMLSAKWAPACKASEDSTGLSHLSGVFFFFSFFGAELKHAFWPDHFLE